MDSVLIFGHKNPDTDSICSAISYSYLKNKLGVNAKPARLGELSKETEFILNYFNIEKPEFIKTVSPQIGDLTHVEKEAIKVTDSLRSALRLMTEENFSSLPVIDDSKKLVGMVHVSDIANTYLELDYKDLFTKYTATYENLKELLEGDVISGDYPKGTINGRLKAASEMPSIEKGDVVVTTSIFDGVDQAISAGAKLIIVCVKDGESIVARESDCAIMTVKSNLFTTLKTITKSISIASILNNNKFFQFKEEDFLSDIKDIVKEAEQSNFPVVGRDGKLYGTIRSKNLINFTRKEVILMDHNEFHQSVDGVKDARILEVIDHHKFGNFETNEPVLIRAETVGCSCTIVYKMYKEAGIVPPKKIAGLLASAILSDTLIFKSPTCTKEDIDAATELCAIAGLDAKKYGMEMLIAGTSLDDKTPSEIITMDSKPFTMGRLDVEIGQVNTVDIQGMLEKKQELKDAMVKQMHSKGLDLFVLAITDIINSGSQVLVVGDNPELIEKAFNVTLDEDTAWLPGVLSRKKQLVPSLMSASQSI